MRNKLIVILVTLLGGNCMNHSLLKKSISVFLCAVMLLSCWVFAAPAANAATRTTYTYEFQLITENEADCNDNEHPVITLYGKPNNGTGGEEQLYTTELDYGYIQSKTTYTYSATTNKFPTKVSLMIHFDAGGWRKWEGKFKLIVNGIYVINDTSNRTLEGGNLFAHERKTMEVSVAGSNYPAISQCSFTQKPPATVTIPRTGDPVFSCGVAAELVDQYGTRWYEDPSLSFETFHTGVQITDGVLTIGPEANSADGSNSTVKINAQYDVLSESVTITLVNATYTYEFLDEAGAVISSGELKSGQTIPKPADLQKASDRSNHYTFLGWTPNDLRLTKDTTFRPNFKQEAHQFLTYTSDKNATCTKDGTKTAVCTCGVEKTVTDEGSALGHSYTYAVTKEPTCTEKGTVTYSCIRCDHTYTTELEAKGHSYVSQVVAPTCEQQGYTLYTCQNCDATYKDNYTGALEHIWNNGNVKKAAGCVEAGEKVYTCSRCGGTRSEEIEPLGHNFKTWTTRSYATCTEDGEKFSTCSRCKQVITQTLPAFGHSWSEWEPNQEPTCEEAGNNMHYCFICGEEEFDPVDSLGHDMVEKTIAPEDGKDGMIYYECSRSGCGKCATCVINAQGEKTMGDYCTPEELEADTVDIPTATFNTYNSVDDGYNYINRGASLRIDPKAPMDTQALRFSASMLIPKGAEIVDFGYVYTREDFLKDIKKFVIGGANVYDISVKDGRFTKHTTEQGEVRTFNVVLNLNQDNWGYNYLARPYIIYQFAGETFTVYDAMYASRSVDFIADKIMQSPTERQEVKDYIQAKIIDR